MSGLADDPVVDENNPGITLARSKMERHSKFENRSIQFQDFLNNGVADGMNDPDNDMAEKDLDMMTYTAPRRSGTVVQVPTCLQLLK